MALSFVAGRDVVIVLDEENLERIQKADPFELDMEKMGVTIVGKPFRIHVCYARSDDKRFKELIEQKNMAGLLAYLSRGFEVKDGDHDRGYTLYATMKVGGSTD